MNIKAIIFDFGDVFINLDKKQAIEDTKKVLGFDIITERLNPKYQPIFDTNDAYEKGKISTDEFLNFYTSIVKHISESDVIALWNSLIKDFPEHRLEFLKQLRQKQEYKLILLSNTNELHINYVKETVSFYEEFKACFDAFYLSHEIHLRKPDAEIYNYVLEQNNLKASECLFIDDTKDNTDAAEQLGIHTWHINPETEDVVNVFEIKSDLF